MKFYKTVFHYEQSVITQSVYFGHNLMKFQILLHVHLLLGNGLVNKFPRRELLGKHSVDRLPKDKEGCVFYVVRGRPRARNGPMNSQSDM
jgi:hypothetical protein